MGRENGCVFGQQGQQGQQGQSILDRSNKSVSEQQQMEPEAMDDYSWMDPIMKAKYEAAQKEDDKKEAEQKNNRDFFAQMTLRMAKREADAKADTDSDTDIEADASTRLSRLLLHQNTVAEDWLRNQQLQNLEQMFEDTPTLKPNTRQVRGLSLILANAMNLTELGEKPNRKLMDSINDNYPRIWSYLKTRQRWSL